MEKTNKYRFLDEPDEKGRPQHLHQLWNEEKKDYENLTGATTVVDVLGKILTWWASGLAVAKFGWLNDKVRENGKVVRTVSLQERLIYLKPIRESINALDDTQYLSLLDEAYKAHSVRLDETADAGTSLHEELELYVRWHMAYNGSSDTEKLKTFNLREWSEKALAFAVWADKNVKRFLWAEGHCYDEKLFMGGISDAGAELKDGSLTIIDFKSAKEAYFNHFIQAGIYDLLIESNGIVDRDGNQIDLPIDVRLKRFDSYIIIPFGAKEFTVVKNANAEGLRTAVHSCVNIYREKALFESGFKIEIIK